MPTTSPASSPLPDICDAQHLFLGDAENPLLAPRGVCLAKNHLIVADTGQNRIFIWEDYARILAERQTHAIPTVVLGQATAQGTGRNAGMEVSAHSLQYPSGIWSDGKRLIVADAWNHRVLIWHRWPTQTGQAADVVLGQPDFASNQPNVEGVGSAPSRQSLNWPYGLCSDGQRLWIADTGNRRVLYFDSIPTENYAPADNIIGKPNFEERDYDHQDAIWPYSVKLGPQGELAITDTQYYRVLVWHDREQAFHQRADQIIGQPDFESNGMNQYGLFPAAHTLNWCYDSCFYKTGLFVADTGNSRVLWFDTVPSTNNAAAVNLIGKPNFNTGSEYSATVFGTENALYWPFSLSVEGQTLALADTGNHRISLQNLLV